MATEYIERNKAVLKQWDMEVFGNHNVEAIDAINAPDYIDYNTYPGQGQGRANFRNLMEEFLKAYPDLRSDPDPLIAESDLVVCPSFFIGTNTGSFLGLPATGQEVISRRVEVIRFADDGTVLERWGVGNDLDKLQVLGVLENLDEGTVKSIGTKEGNEEVARLFVDEFFNKKNLAAVSDLIEPRARLDTHGIMSLCQLCMAFPDLKVDVHGVSAVSGRVIVMDLGLKGTHTGIGLGDPTNREVSGQHMLLMYVADSKVWGIWHDIDKNQVAQQLTAKGKSKGKA